MPQNPALFPTQYSNLCPSTQLQTVDQYAQLQAELIVLRHQHLLNARKEGVSLAELQNQTVRSEYVNLSAVQTPPPIVNYNTYNTIIQQITQIVSAPVTYTAPTTPAPSAPPPAPAPAVPAPVKPSGTGKFFIGGGEANGVHGQTQKFTPANEQLTAAGFGMQSTRMRHTGAASSAKGYWFGGQTTGVVSSRTSSIEAVDLAYERQLAISARLSTAKVYSRAAWNGTAAAIAGDYSNSGASSGPYDVMTFANESVTAVGTLPASVGGGCNAFQATITGYFCNGYGGIRSIVRVNLTNNAAADTGAQTNVPRLAAAAFNSSSAGFISGGWNDSAQVRHSTTESYNFAGNSVKAIGSALPAPDDDLEAASAYQGGYRFGGHIQQQQINFFNFAQNSWRSVGSTLARGGRYSTPVGNP